MNLCGIHKEATSIIFQDTSRRLKILQNLCRQYSFENDTTINSMDSKNISLPKINNSEFISKTNLSSYTFQKNDRVKKCSTFSSDSIENVKYGHCGRFERRMCNILESIEIKSSEMISSNIKSSIGKIQQGKKNFILEKKLKEDLQFISKCLLNLVKEIDEKGTFQYLINLVHFSKSTEKDTSNLIITEKQSLKNIGFVKDEIIKSKNEFNIRHMEYLTLIQHLKHQKQEKQQKIRMEYQFHVKRLSGFISELKDQLKREEKNLTDEFNCYINNIKNEEKVNIELMMFLRNNIQLMEQSIEHWIDIYNKETKKLQIILKNLNTNYIQINSDFKIMQETYNKYEIICKEARRQAIKAAKIAEIEAHFNRKALLIQNWWRYMCCKLLIGPYSKKRKKKSKK